jgi:ribonuclease D
MKHDISPKPQWIDDQTELIALIDHLSSEERLAMDTESNSLYAYQEQVCLIQISIPDADYLLDAINLPDLTPLDDLMSDVKKEKVFHGAEYDVICLKRDFNFNIKNLFDTRVALRTLGRVRTGLGDVLEEEFGVKINKRWQRANWGQRPLPPELLNYAYLDTHYLLTLRDRLAKELVAHDHWEEVKEECDRITTFEANENNHDPNNFWKIANAKQLAPHQAAILKEIYSYRDERARQMNRPPFKVIPNKTLMAIAQSSPKTIAELQKLPGMTQGQIKRYGKDLLEGVAKGRQSTPPKRPRKNRIDDSVVNRYKRLRKWRKTTAGTRRVDSDIILPREIMWSIASEAPTTKAALHEIMQPLDRRFKLYGDAILQVIQS